MSKIFISYRRDDSADISGRIYDRLVGKFGADAIFKDVNSIPFGVNFKLYLEDIINQCTVELVIIGRKWLDITNDYGFRRLEDPADFVRIEVEAALRRNIPVIPLLVGGASMPKEKFLPPSMSELAYRNGTPVRPDPDFHHDMDRLINSLEKWLTPIATPVLLPTAAAVSTSATAIPTKEIDTLPTLDSNKRKRARLVDAETQPSRPAPIISTHNIKGGPVALASLEWCDIPAGNVTLEDRVFRGGLKIRDRIHHVASFRMAKYPVTNAQFQAFIDASDGYFNPKWWEFSPQARQWHLATPKPMLPTFSGDECPRENVSWYEAVAFCLWLSKKMRLNVTLPTEQQWQRAAQGSDQREFPWGNDVDRRRCNSSESNIGRTTPIDRYPRGASPFRVYDMVGNVQEWCLNDFANIDNTTISADVDRVIRGGSWKYKMVRVASREKLAPGHRLDSVGFRVICVDEVFVSGK